MPAIFFRTFFPNCYLNVNDILCFSQGDDYESYVKTELIKRMMNCYPKDFVDDELARNRCRDKILESVSLSQQVCHRIICNSTCICPIMAS